MKVKKYLKSLLYSIFGFLLWRGLLERLIMACPARIYGGQDVHVLLAAPGAGNIGDQAMLESFLENVPGNVVVIVRRCNDVAIPACYQQRARVVELPAIVYGGGIERIKNLFAFRSLLSEAASFSVVGADIMDGAYNPKASIRRSNLARSAASFGVSARILGFSWNGCAERAARAALRSASIAGVQLILRDPVSVERARADGLENIVSGADMVFSATAMAKAGLDQLVPGLRSDEDYVLVNISALVEKTFDQMSEYQSLIRHIQSKGVNVVLLPHVARSGSSDIEMCTRMYESLGDKNLFLVGQIFEPEQVRRLSSEARLVVTGRMHLAIIAMSQSVPAFTLATQGKVEGLMRHFDMSEMCITPRKGFSFEVIAQVNRVLADREGWVGRLTAALPEVRRLSSYNFSELKK